MARTLKEPFKDNNYWWASVELLRRYIIVILIVTVPRNVVSYLDYVHLISYIEKFADLRISYNRF